MEPIGIDDEEGDDIPQLLYSDISGWDPRAVVCVYLHQVSRTGVTGLIDSGVAFQEPCKPSFSACLSVLH